jgi:uncharacterized RDD family membrane protein YckC
MEETNYPAASGSLTDELSSEIQLQYASTSQRFLNYLIDNLLMQFGLSYATGAAVGILLGLLFPEYIIRISENPERMDVYVLGYVIAIVNYLLYYTICEKGFKGYTLGKAITGTRAIREDGGELTLRNAFLRTLSRLVPFEALSGFGGHPWHDTWTKTMVVKTR